MDPTKSFDHLDPKLKETYARVMGTATPAAGSAPAASDPSFSVGVPVPPPVADPSLPVNSPVTEPPVPLGDPAQSQINANPMDQSFTSNPGENPNPGTGPTISTLPSGTSTMFSTQPAEVPPPAGQALDPTAPTTSSFFSNPSPVATEPQQTPDQNSAPVTEVPAGIQAPVTPYSPENVAGIPPPVPNEFSQPLPPPSTVVHSGMKQTSALLKVLYIVAAVVFFAVYTIFWIKVFNLPFFF